MTSGFKSSTAAIAVLAGMAIGSMPAAAADLGGDCCADLEERIAELEATTARKGNRKVKLEVSGHVNEALFFWDDGVESNVGQYTNDNSRTRFRFKGSAKISDDVKAGYLLEIGVRGANSKRFTQDDPEGGNGLDTRHSAWYIDSKTYGTVWVGQTAPAAEGITEINQTQTADVAKFSDVEDSALGLGVRTITGALVQTQSQGQNQLLGFRRAIRDSGDQPGEPERGNIVKYISPEFAGFLASAAWGADDYWDIGLRYKGDFAGFSVAAGIAYGKETSEGGDAEGQIGNCNASGNATGVDCEQIGGSLSVLHTESGLYVNLAAGQSTDNNAGALYAGTGEEDSTFYSIEGGIEKKFFPLGKTTIFGQYYDADSGSTNRRFFTDNAADGPLIGQNARIFGADLEMYGFGLVQGIDAAAMSLYVYYRHVEADFDLRQAGTVNEIATPGLEDLDMVVAGGIIKF